MIDEANIKAIKELKLAMDPKPTKLKYCTYFFKSGESCITCYDCCTDSDYYYCQGCWEEENHRGHHYDISPVYYEGRASCACGRKDRIK